MKGKDIIALAGREWEEERKVNLQIHTAPQSILNLCFPLFWSDKSKMMKDWQSVGYCGSQVNGKNANQFSAVQKMWIKKKRRLCAIKYWLCKWKKKFWKVNMARVSTRNILRHFSGMNGMKPNVQMWKKTLCLSSGKWSKQKEYNTQIKQYKWTQRSRSKNVTFFHSLSPAAL